jgi:hypothetical protein
MTRALAKKILDAVKDGAIYTPEIVDLALMWSGDLRA